MRSKAIIIFLLVVVFSGWLAVSAFAQPASLQGPPPLVWCGIDVERAIQLLANIAVISGIIGATAAARLGYRELEESRKARNAETTLRFFEHYHSDRMGHAIDCIRQKELQSADKRLDFAKVTADPKVERCFWNVADTYETIALLVQRREWDPEVAEQLVGELMRRYWRYCKPVVVRYREEWKWPDVWKPWETYATKSQE